MVVGRRVHTSGPFMVRHLCVCMCVCVCVCVCMCAWACVIIKRKHLYNFLLNLKEGDFIRREENFRSDIIVKCWFQETALSDKIESFNIIDNSTVNGGNRKMKGKWKWSSKELWTMNSARLYMHLQCLTTFDLVLTIQQLLYTSELVLPGQNQASNWLV